MAPELETYIPFFLHLLGAESDEHPLPDYLSGEELRGALGEALVGTFTLGSREEPLVVFLDNWHWADGGSKEVLGQLAGMVATHALLIVVTTRPDPEGESVPLRGDVHR